ncbi:MAG: hypothetical protein JXQ29_08395 [Planctomycetes bacterium]|nr:hypothetical protein [Planctomycetota bacterium]
MMANDGGRKNGNGTLNRKFWDYLSRVASGVTILLGAALISHHVRLAVIENSMFTKSDLREIQMLVVEVRELKVIVRDNNAQVQERLRDLEKRIGGDKNP